MICETCGKIISEEMYREFGAKCLECIQISLDKFTSEKNSAIKDNQAKLKKAIEKCVICGNPSIGQCRSCNKIVCRAHAHIKMTWIDDIITCNSCQESKSVIACVVSIPIMILCLIISLI